MCTILIIMAMDKESHNFAAKYDFQAVADQFLIPDVPCEIYEKVVAPTKKIILVISGKCPLHGVNRIGPAINLIALTAITSIRPDYVINAGFAGGVAKQGAALGDIYLNAEAIYYHDRHFTEQDKYRTYSEGGFPGYCSAKLTEAIQAKQGQMTTSGSMLSATEEQQNMERLQTVVKDMEAAAIAEVAFLCQTKFIALKVITDLIDLAPCPQAAFEQNYPGLVATLKAATWTAATYLINQKPDKNNST